MWVNMTRSSSICSFQQRLENCRDPHCHNLSNFFWKTLYPTAKILNLAGYIVYPRDTPNKPPIEFSNESGTK